MNNTSIKDIETKKQNILQKYNLDKESVKLYKKEIAEVSTEEQDILGKELLELISGNNYSEANDLEKVISIIKKGANIEYKNEKKGDFALLICARKNYLKTFIELLKAGANINQKNNYLTTTIMAAARHGNKEMVELLIIMNADINARCLDGDSAIMSAKIHQKKECYDLLMEANAYLNNRNLLNQTILDIKGDSDFGASKVTKSLQQETKKTTHEDALSLVDEAIKKLQKLSQ